MERITRKQVLALAVTVSVKHPAPLDIQQLDRANGQAWRLFVLAEYPANHGRFNYPGLDDGFLGSTNREAYQTLRGILAGMEAQRLAQAETIRRANGWLVAASASVSEAADLNDLASVVAKLDELAPPTEF